MDVLTKIGLAAIGIRPVAFGCFGLNLLFARSFAAFPSPAFFINVASYFLIGLLVTILGEEYEISEKARLLIILGFSGAFTVFSTLEFETFSFLRDKDLATVIIYILLSFSLGLISALGGIWVGKKFQ